MNRPQQFTKVDLKPRRHHGYAVVLFIFGTLFPPLAVAARFGIGRDFFLNLFLTVCGYIPGHVHNFYIQNIRNNKNNRRTPKWASRYGLVDTTEIERKKKKSQWATRYNDRLPNSTLEGQEYEEGQTAGRSAENVDETTPRSRADGTLWNNEEESYYGRGDRAGSSASLKSTGSAGRWHYPANFDEAEPIPGKKKKKEKKDRWARAEDARLGVGMEDGSRKKKKKKKSRATADTNGDFINPRRSYDSSTAEGPEDPEGRRYDPNHREAAMNGTGGAGEQRDEFDHQF